jgi:hypothetical protein
MLLIKVMIFYTILQYNNIAKVLCKLIYGMHKDDDCSTISTLPGLIKSDRPKSINFIGALSSLVVKRKFCPNEIYQLGQK